MISMGRILYNLRGNSKTSKLECNVHVRCITGNMDVALLLEVWPPQDVDAGLLGSNSLENLFNADRKYC